MNVERKELLEKIHQQISERTNELLNDAPITHEIDDGIVIRFFDSWSDCNGMNGIKYREIKNKTNPLNKSHFFYVPKNSYFDIKKNNNFKTIVCLNGKIEITINGKTEVINGYTRYRLGEEVFKGKSLENSYIVAESF